MDNQTTQSPAISYNLSSNEKIRETARTLLKNKWNKCALITLIFLAITGIVSALKETGSLINFIITGPFNLGMVIIFLKVIRQQDFSYEDLFEGFNNFFKAFLAHVLMSLFIILWTLLLIVPGVIAALSYSLTYFIIADNPGLTANEARLKSIELMRGYKTELFFLGLSFIGWFLLSLLTAGIGLLWFIPYIYTSIALFYKKVITEKSGNF